MNDRASYRRFLTMPTRWSDNDSYGHVNNVTYYSYFDTAVNEHLIREGGLSIADSAHVGVVVETFCRFHRPLSFPMRLDVGLRVAKLGRSSVTYDIAIFPDAGSEASASGHFVHVWVDRATRQPSAIPPQIRAALEPLLVVA
jgi:acyl-CoA thioester hydrolase